jgi:hypothetical protein
VRAQCLWSKTLWMEGLEELYVKRRALRPEEVADLMDLMTEKTLRFHVDPPDMRIDPLAAAAAITRRLAATAAAPSLDDDDELEEEVGEEDFEPAETDEDASSEAASVGEPGEEEAEGGRAVAATAAEVAANEAAAPAVSVAEAMDLLNSVAGAVYGRDAQ